MTETECMISIAVMISLTVLIIIGIILARNYEKKKYNNGICPRCGNPLRNFDIDSQGGRGYICDECFYRTWCSYNVDGYKKRR